MTKKIKETKKSKPKVQAIFINTSIYNNSPNIQHVTSTKDKETFITNNTL